MNMFRSIFVSKYIEKYFSEKKLNLRATLDYKDAFTDAKYIIISTPTNYNEVDVTKVKNINGEVLTLTSGEISVRLC